MTYHVTDKNKERILILKGGPQYELKGAFQKWLEGLSNKYEGDVIVFDSKRTEIGSFTVHSLKYKGGSTIRLLRYWRLVYNLHKVNSYKLIVAYDPLKTGLVGLLGIALGKSKLIIEINGDYSNLANYSEIKNKHIQRLKRWAYLSIGQIVLNYASGIKLQYLGLLAPYKIDTQSKIVEQFPNFVDVDRFSNTEQSNVILTIGFPIHIKGIDILVEAFKQVTDDFPDWELVILGWFEHEMTNLNKLTNHERITYHPPVKSSEIPNIIGTCGIYVSASRTEGVARVLLEAMAAEKPIIASNVGGTPNIISNKSEGLLFESENTTELACHLKQLMSDPILRLNLGAAAKARLTKDFSNESYFENTDRLYQQVLSQ